MTFPKEIGFTLFGSVMMLSRENIVPLDKKSIVELFYDSSIYPFS
jgi:hypothetical protein